jgi:hypothetical protein
MILAAKQTSYSKCALLSVLICEVLVIVGLRCQIPALSIGSLAAMFLSCLLMIGLGWGHLRYPFWPNKKTFTKLMANAIAPSWLGAGYLLLFVIHIGWLSDGSLNFFQTDNRYLLQDSISLITSILGGLELICFFPEGKQDKENAKQAVFVSGISKLSSVKITHNGKEMKLFSLYNVEPLVKIFNLCFKAKTVESSGVSKLLILSSETHYQSDFFKNGLVELTKLKTGTVDYEGLFDTDCIINDVSVNKGGKEERVTCLKLPNYELDTATSEEGLRKVIRCAAICQYPEMKDYFNQLKIEFTSPCNYDNFEQCFGVLSDAVKKEDQSRDVRLYFNLTPGTGIVGSLMTLFSLDKYRNLYFYAQNSSKEILSVDKSKVPLENLISQALDTE